MTEQNLKNIVLKMPTLETERLIIRKITKKDVQDFFELSSNENVSRYLTWSPHENLSYTKEYLRFLIKKYKTGEYLDWGIELKSSGKLIGTCGFTSIELSHSKAEIGYVLNEEFWGNGYAGEAVKRIIKYSFDFLKLNRLEARVIKGNDVSLRLLKKEGFKLEGVFQDELFIKGEFKDILHLSLLRKDYINDI